MLNAETESAETSEERGFEKVIPLNRPRLTRALRIAWSVAWGILAVLLTAV